MRCAVINCKNNNKNKNKKWRYFQFPKQKDVCNKWLEFCRRKGELNVKTACVCSAHFAPEDFERNLQFEMGLASKNPTKLRSGAVPTVESNSPVVNAIKKDFAEQSRKELVASLLQESTCSANESADNIPPEHTKLLEVEMEKLKREVFMLKEAKRVYDAEIQNLKTYIKKAEVERDNMESKLKCIFSEGQVDKLKKGTKRQLWNEKDIAKSMKLYSTSSKAYKLLRNKNFPLPAVRTLRSWASKIEISPGH